MKLFGLPVIKHACVPADEAWIIRCPDANELPAELRGRVKTPCVLAGDVELLAEAVILARLTRLHEEINLTTKALTTNVAHRRCKKIRRRLHKLPGTSPRPAASNVA